MLIHSEEKTIHTIVYSATLLDETGGGHANACGCRIQPSDGSKRKLIHGDKNQTWIFGLKNGQSAIRK